MSEFNDLVERYIAVWNEVDPDRRQRLIAETFSEGASYIDPLMASEGHAAINGMVRAVQERFPGHRFHRAGTVDGNHDRIRFHWELATEGARRRQGHRLRHGRERAHNHSNRLYRSGAYLNPQCLPRGPASTGHLWGEPRLCAPVRQYSPMRDSRMKTPHDLFRRIQTFSLRNVGRRR